MDSKFDGLQEIIDKALASMEAESTGDFDPQECNLAEFCRRTGLTRQRARAIKANGFRVRPHGRLGMKAGSTVLSGRTGFVDEQLRKGVTNSQVVYERLLGQGYEGGLTTVKVYMADHADLVPAKRRATGPQRGSGQRFRSGPAESYTSPPSSTPPASRGAASRGAHPSSREEPASGLQQVHGRLGLVKPQRTEREYPLLGLRRMPASNPLCAR